MAADFDWDPVKDAENLRKHGVSFGEAQIAFLDPGRVSEGVLTVRFTYRGNIIRIIGAGFWRRGRKLYEAHSKVHR